MYSIKLVVTYHFCVKSKLIKIITNVILIKLIRIILKKKKQINMITFTNISLSFLGKKLLDDINFQLNSKEKIGLIGRNGSGKSTLLSLILNKLEPDDGKIIISKNYKIGLVEQKIEFSYETVLDEIISVLPDERYYESWKGEKILSGLGFTTEEILQNPKNLSGGNQVKVNLAKLLLYEPDLLLLDEPTNYLDIFSIKWLQNFLHNWKKELILITHNRFFMDSIISHTIYIHRNTVRKIEGNSKKLLNLIKKEEDIYESTRVNQVKDRKRKEEWIKRFQSKATLASRAQSRVKMLEKEVVLEKLNYDENLNFHFNYLLYKSKKSMIEVENIRFGYSLKNILINDLTFKLNKGDKVCVIGKNGKGKSTLLKLLVGEEKIISGSITNNLLETGYFGQMNIDRLNSELTIYEELYKSANNKNETEIRKTCAQVMFKGDTVEKKIGVLSGGEKSRVMLGKILLKNVNFLILDEPTNHLDMYSAESFMKAVNKFEGAVLMVTHDEKFIKQIANKLIIFDRNKVFVFNGGYDDFIKKIGWQETISEQVN